MIKDADTIKVQLFKERTVFNPRSYKAFLLSELI